MTNAGRICCALAVLWASMPAMAAGMVRFLNKSKEEARVSVVGVDGQTYPDKTGLACPAGQSVIVSFSCPKIKNAYANFADGKVVGCDVENSPNARGGSIEFSRDRIAPAADQGGK